MIRRQEMNSAVLTGRLWYHADQTGNIVYFSKNLYSIRDGSQFKFIDRFFSHLHDILYI